MTDYRVCCEPCDRSSMCCEQHSCCVECHCSFEELYACPFLPKALADQIRREHHELQKAGWPRDKVLEHSKREDAIFRQYCPKEVLEQIDHDHQAYAANILKLQPQEKLMSTSQISVGALASPARDEVTEIYRGIAAARGLPQQIDPRNVSHAPAAQEWLLTRARIGGLRSRFPLATLRLLSSDPQKDETCILVGTNEGAESGKGPHYVCCFTEGKAKGTCVPVDIQEPFEPDEDEEQPKPSRPGIASSFRTREERVMSRRIPSNLAYFQQPQQQPVSVPQSRAPMPSQDQQHAIDVGRGGGGRGGGGRGRWWGGGGGWGGYYWPYYYTYPYYTYPYYGYGYGYPGYGYGYGQTAPQQPAEQGDYECITFDAAGNCTMLRRRGTGAPAAATATVANPGLPSYAAPRSRRPMLARLKAAYGG